MKPRLILISDDQAILELGEHITPDQAEQWKAILNDALKRKDSLLLANGPWDVVDRRKPDIEKRLAAVEAWIAAHDDEHGSKTG